MNRVYWQAAGLLGLSAVISLVLWLNGFPPEWDTDKGETVSAVRNFLTTPFAIVGVGTGLTASATVQARRVEYIRQGEVDCGYVCPVYAGPDALLAGHDAACAL